MLRFLAACLLAGATLLAPACAGQAARTHVLAPEVAKNVDSLRDDAALGAATLHDSAMQDAAALAISRFFTAAKSGDRAAILGAMGDWVLVESLIVKGIDQRVALGQADAQTRKSYDNQREKFAESLARVVEGVK